jgi:SPW repeat
MWPSRALTDLAREARAHPGEARTVDRKDTHSMTSSRDTQRQDPQSSRRNSILDIYTLTLAVFSFASPWLFSYASETGRIDLWASSALVAAVSIAAIIAFSEWEEWVTLALGIWLVTAPWLLGFAHAKAVHMCVGAGSVIAYLAALQLWLAHYGDPVSPEREKGQAG